MLLTYYIAAVAGVVLLLQILQRHVLVFCLVALPGTIAHELTHLVLGWMTGGRPRGLSIIPRRRGNAYILGAVTLANVRWYNGLFIGLSPLLLFPAAAFLVQWRVTLPHPVTFPDEIMWGYFAATLINGGVPSMQDVRIAAASAWWVVPGLLLAAGCYLAEIGVINVFALKTVIWPAWR